jgi:hypothetical protein
MRESQALPADEPGAGGEGIWEAAWHAEATPDTLSDCDSYLPAVDAGTVSPDSGT